MKEPSIGKENLGAVIGAVTGALGGLFAVAIPLAILTRNLQALSAARTFGLVSFLVCTPIGWFAGGYLSHAMTKRLGEKKAAMIGGLIGGLFPVTGFALWGFYMIMR
ncbi:MAG: hypothetical protein V9H26_05115 [Verrucomicrobiota bacterium]|nr:hypothetical protein [Verrucomicrobiota bacterium]